jgi:hypothetical protein
MTAAQIGRPARMLLFSSKRLARCALLADRSGLLRFRLMVSASILLVED